MGAELIAAAAGGKEKNHMEIRRESSREDFWLQTLVEVTSQRCSQKASFLFFFLQKN